MRLVSALLVVSCFACTACGKTEPAPDGEAVIVVDTNLPVPGIASRLRIDVFASDGTWVATRDDVRPDTRDWPASFSVFNDDPAKEPVAIVRLRAYPEGRLVRYNGIIYAPLPELLHGVPKGDDQPRLILNGVDQTPEFEPDPAVTVDQVVRVRLAYGQRGRVRVLLDGACVGQMARLVPWSDVRSCVDGTDPLAAAEIAPVEDSLDYDLPTKAGTWGREPCLVTPPESASSDRVCVPGGGFLLGDAFLRTSDTFSNGAPANPHPERVLRISRFVIDRDEVSVARFRAAMARGFTEVTPVGTLEKDGPPGADLDYSCTYSASPRGREDYPVSCVPWDTARAFCRFEGGDLPTEAQWEYVAVAAGRSAKATYPWGDDPPDCSRAVYARTFLFPECVQLGTGVPPLVAPGTNDAASSSHPLGLRNLAGSLFEHTLDTLLPYDDACWTHASSVDPMCWVDLRPGCPDDKNTDCITDPGRLHGMRGGSWVSPYQELLPVLRVEGNSGTWRDVRMGFRCVYPGK
ncbi:MAG: formylglycine-generating enzyme family protein [Deltaproteobacteria bacterium]|nr:formylglycine-generating enzyme family protein [Deltaproteobacteria bacterium]